MSSLRNSKLTNSGKPLSLSGDPIVKELRSAASAVESATLQVQKAMLTLKNSFQPKVIAALKKADNALQDAEAAIDAGIKNPSGAPKK